MTNIRYVGGEPEQLVEGECVGGEPQQEECAVETNKTALMNIIMIVMTILLMIMTPIS